MNEMEFNGSTPVRLTMKQARALVEAMINTNATEVEITRGEDGRLIVKQVTRVEKLRALKIS
jgi:hypothetical protein